MIELNIRSHNKRHAILTGTLHYVQYITYRKTPSTRIYLRNALNKIGCFLYLEFEQIYTGTGWLCIPSKYVVTPINCIDIITTVSYIRIV